jgi:hypothetical protein
MKIWRKKAPNPKAEELFYRLEFHRAGNGWIWKLLYDGYVVDEARTPTTIRIGYRQAVSAASPGKIITAKIWRPQDEV